MLDESASPLGKVWIGHRQKIDHCGSDVVVGHDAQALASLFFQKGAGDAPRLNDAANQGFFGLVHDGIIRRGSIPAFVFTRVFRYNSGLAWIPAFAGMTIDPLPHRLARSFDCGALRNGGLNP